MTKRAGSSNWFTVAEVAEKLAVSKMTVYRMMSLQEITAYKFGRAFRIKPEDLNTYIENNKV